MNDKIYYSPINGELLQLGSDGLLHGTGSDLAYTINRSNQVIPLKSPLHGGELYLGNDGLFYSKHDNFKYMINDGKIIPLRSPLHGGELTNDDNGSYSSKYDNTKYMVSSDGVIKPLIDPFNGGNLIPNQDGTYQSQNTEKSFAYDDTKNAFIPLYVPDDTAENAHIEDGMLVTNETERKFEIDENGEILTPQEIAFRAAKQQEKELFEQMERDGTIEQYLEGVEQRKRAQHPLTREEIREIANEDLSTKDAGIDGLQNMNKPVNQQDKPLAASAQAFIIQEFLDSNNITNEKDFINYLKGLGMDERIIDCLGKTNGTNFMSTLGQDFNAQLLIISKENGDKTLYIPTTQSSQVAISIELIHNGNVRMTENHHTPVMVDGIRYGNVNVVDMSINSNGDLNLVESHHQVMPYDGLQSVDSKPRSVASSSQRPMVITSSGEIRQEMEINKQVVLDTIGNGVLKPIQTHEDLENKLQDLRNMGFNEKYFTKTKISGINYDINGNETFFESEDLNYIPELGIYINNLTLAQSAIIEGAGHKL